MTERPSMMLTVVGPSDVSATHAWDGNNPLWFGRDPGCDVVLTGEAVSRRHFVVEVWGTAVRVSDMSANGTRVNGQLLHRASLLVSSNATFAVGDQVITLHFDADAVPTPPDGHSMPPQVELSAAQRRRIHRALLDHLDLPAFDRERADVDKLRPRVIRALDAVIDAASRELPAGVDRAALVSELTDEALGLGPLEPLLRDPLVSEIMVVDPTTIFVERGGRIEQATARFTDDDAVRTVIERIVTPLGRRIDESNPVVDARLPDGSRVNAVIPPLALKGAAITIRRFARTPLTMANLVERGAMSDRMATLLSRAVMVRRNVLIAGGTGSGKTTLLNVLSSCIGSHERVVTIEDAAELQLAQPHVVSLEARPPNMEGKGAVTIRDLVRNALRMRPDRIVVGECRGGEALDMLQAMNTGHDGSMTTLHASSPRETIARLETLCLMAGLDLPIHAIRAQIAASVHVLVQQARFADGTRRVTAISEVVGIDQDGRVGLCDIFRFVSEGVGADGRCVGQFRPTGYIPSFIDQVIRQGLVTEGDYL